MIQYSLFGAAALAPSLDDLDGLLLAGGQWVRAVGSARLSVLVRQTWRAAALDDEFRVRGIEAPGSRLPETGGIAARTALCPALMPHAGRWTRGARIGLPAQFRLSAGGLRLWVIAAGGGDDSGYLLTTADDEVLHAAAGASLARLGVAAISLGPRGTAPAGSRRPVPGWRVTSVKRLRRLVELVGPPPDGAQTTDWPAIPGPSVGYAAGRLRASRTVS